MLQKEENLSRLQQDKFLIVLQEKFSANCMKLIWSRLQKITLQVERVIL